MMSSLPFVLNESVFVTTVMLTLYEAGARVAVRVDLQDSGIPHRGHAGIYYDRITGLRYSPVLVDMPADDGLEPGRQQRYGLAAYVDSSRYPVLVALWRSV